MKIIHDLNIHEPSVLTIGNFDGVHIGHQAVLNRVIQTAKENNLASTVITFENHPYEVLHPETKVSTICSLPHKIQLLKKMGIDILLLLKFTAEFSQQTAEEFLTKIFKACPFSHLVLGHDAAFGKDKQGDKKHIQSFAHQLGFQVEYIPPYKIKDTLVSSSVIKNLIQKRQFSEASTLLGRPYSIIASQMENLCLPPEGTYPALIDNKKTSVTIHNQSIFINEKVLNTNTEIVFI